MQRQANPLCFKGNPELNEIEVLLQSLKKKVDDLKTCPETDAKNEETLDHHKYRILLKIHAELYAMVATFRAERCDATEIPRKTKLVDDLLKILNKFLLDEQIMEILYKPRNNYKKVGTYLSCFGSPLVTGLAAAAIGVSTGGAAAIGLFGGVVLHEGIQKMTDGHSLRSTYIEKDSKAKPYEAIPDCVKQLTTLKSKLESLDMLFKVNASDAKAMVPKPI